MEHDKQELLARELCDDTKRTAYKQAHDNLPISPFPRICANILIGAGNVMYGELPSYQKFRAIEIIARTPYHSWVSATYTLLTWFYADEARALQLSKFSRFAGEAQDNETMHVVVISKLARSEGNANAIIHTFVPLIFSFGYFWFSYLLCLVNKRYSLELNYMFEQHAYEQYDAFIATHKEALLNKKVESVFLDQYGRTVANQLEFFTLVRSDELIHRNTSAGSIP